MRLIVYRAVHLWVTLFVDPLRLITLDEREMQVDIHDFFDFFQVQQHMKNLKDITEYFGLPVVAIDPFVFETVTKHVYYTVFRYRGALRLPLTGEEVSLSI